jgi:colanic acid biosynthesis glycosyl transferase WcaI
MRIHIITNLFAPDELAGAALFTDLALYLKGHGHDVRVTCTFSYYPAWKLRPEDQGVAIRDELFQDIHVRRVAMHVPKQATGKGRMLSDLSFLLSLIRRARHPAWQPEVVLTALPMLSQCLAQRFLYWRKSIPRLIVVQDFVVESALELGVLRLPGFGPLLRGMQRWALRSAETLLTISPSMLDRLRKIVGSDRRTGSVPNWIHSSLDREIARQYQNGYARQQGRLFYSGNVGVKQGLPDFLDQFKAAEVATAGWYLAIHGDGAERRRLQHKIDLTPGCSLGPVLDEAEYIRSLLTTSACLVTQRPGLGANFLPSKLLPALATGTPVLAVCDPSSPLGEEVIAGGFGEVVTPGVPAKLGETLHRWRTEPELLATMSRKARERARLYHRDTILSQYEAELLRLVTRI